MVKILPNIALKLWLYSRINVFLLKLLKLKVSQLFNAFWVNGINPPLKFMRETARFYNFSYGLTKTISKHNPSKKLPKKSK